MITNRDIVEAYVDATGQRRARDIGNSLFANIFNPLDWEDELLEGLPESIVQRPRHKRFQNRCLRCEQPINHRKVFCASCGHDRISENRKRRRNDD
jgi:ribosomal protein L37E